MLLTKCMNVILELLQCYSGNLQASLLLQWTPCPLTGSSQLVCPPACLLAGMLQWRKHKPLWCFAAEEGVLVAQAEQRIQAAARALPSLLLQPIKWCLVACVVLLSRLAHGPLGCLRSNGVPS